ncbi:MAG: NAD-dependent epimerase/dehydratase family protein [Gammaproteobacteria bacterium]|nr:NAD-dependent epimerase/dehydratase family protein [Gammaproteobacteria bacterium]
MANPIGPHDGPVAVTGSAGYIGSHIVKDLIEHGYTVRACVRDAANLANTAHLSAMNAIGPGSVTLHTCDLTVPGAYDEAFNDCVGVFHAAAEMGNLAGSTPQKVYDGGLTATRLLLDSLKKAGTVRRLVYTSSFAAVGHPAPEGHVYTEDSWADMNKDQRREGSAWDMDTVARNREVAYAMTKVETERYVYAEAAAHGFEAFGVCPCHVIGPLLSATHQRPWAWQTRIGDMLEGYGHPRMFWNIVDVRDVAAAERLIIECPDNANGDRYNLVATDESGIMPQEAVQAILRRLYPGIGIGGNYRDGPTRRGPIATLEKVVSQLGHTPKSAEEAIRDNADSLLSWGLVQTRAGEDNWQRDGRDLGIKSKWNPHTYPAIDPALRKELEAGNP